MDVILYTSPRQLEGPLRLLAGHQPIRGAVHLKLPGGYRQALNEIHKHTAEFRELRALQTRFNKLGNVTGTEHSPCASSFLEHLYALQD